MQTYIVDYNFGKWHPDGNAFLLTPGYHDYKRVTIKAENIDNLRLRLIQDYAKGRPFRCYVCRPTKEGYPGQDLGKLINYPDGYFWFKGRGNRGVMISPKTGRRA